MGKLILAMAFINFCLMTAITGMIIWGHIKRNIVLPLSRKILNLVINDTYDALKNFQYHIDEKSDKFLITDGVKKIAEIEKEINNLVEKANLSYLDNCKEIFGFMVCFEKINQTIVGHDKELKVFLQKKEKIAC